MDATLMTRPPSQRTGNAAWVTNGAPSLRTDLARDRLCVLRLSRCDSDVGARAGESDRDRAADAATAAGDQRTLAVQVKWRGHFSVAGYVRCGRSRPRSRHPRTRDPPT